MPGNDLAFLLSQIGELQARLSGVERDIHDPIRVPDHVIPPQNFDYPFRVEKRSGGLYVSAGYSAAYLSGDLHAEKFYSGTLISHDLSNDLFIWIEYTHLYEATAGSFSSSIQSGAAFPADTAAVAVVKIASYESGVLNQCAHGTIKIEDAMRKQVKSVILTSVLHTIPAFWAICDGTGGTVNLVGKFIRGAAATSGTTGGSDSHVHTASADITIDASVTMDSHIHSFDNGTGYSFPIGEGALSPEMTAWPGEGTTDVSGTTSTGTVTATCSNADVTVDSASCLPSYAELVFIQRM